MKKFGFTLAELMIALSIIGVTAVLVAPLVVDLMPDANKAKILKYRSQIETAIAEMYENPDIYHPVSIPANDPNDPTLMNLSIDFDGIDRWTNDPNISPETCEGISCMQFDDGRTFIEELQLRLNINEDNRTPDNSEWTIQETDVPSWSIEINLKPQEDTCIYAENNCTLRDANTFRLNIDTHGNVNAGDPLTEAYFRNPLNLNSRREDFAEAERLRE